MGLDGLSGLSGLSGLISSAFALGPIQGIGGNSLVNLHDFGEDYPDVAAAVANPAYYFPQIPEVLVTSAGTILFATDLLVSTGGDNTGGYVSIKRSTDKGVTWTKGAALASQSPLGTNGYAIPRLIQKGSTIYAFISETVYANNTAGPWKDYAGNSPAQVIAVKLFLSTSTDDGVTWSGLTDITSHIVVVNQADTLTPLGTNATNSIGRGSYRVVTPTQTFIDPGKYILVQFSGITGTNATQLNYATNGNVAYYCNVVDSTHIDILDAAAPAFSAGTTFTSATALPQAGWFVPGERGCLNQAGNIVLPMNGRTGVFPQGTPFGFSLVYDGSTFTVSTQTTVNGQVGEIEPSICSLGGNNLYMTFRQASGNYRGHKISTDGGATWGAQIIDDGTGGTTALTGTATLAPILALGGGQFVMVAPADPTNRRCLVAWYSKNLTTSGGTWRPRRISWGQGGYSGLDLLSNGTIVCAYSKDYIDNGVSSIAAGRIGALQFNAAYAANTANAFDEMRFALIELPSGKTAWTSCPAIRDWGGLDHHAIVNGTPVYAAGGLPLTAANYITLAPAADGAFDPDFLSSDSGSFTLEFEIKGTATGVLMGGISTVGTAGGSTTKGYSVLVNGSGKVVFTIDDGSHFGQLTSTAVVNDGSGYRVLVQRNATSKLMSITIYNATTGAVLDTESTTPLFVSGSLTNLTPAKCLGRYGDTATGGLSAAMTFRLFRYVNGVTTAPLPFPYVPPTADGFAATGSANSPDQVGTAGKLKLWVGDSRGGFNCRGKSNMPSLLLHPPAGACAFGGFVDQANGFFPTQTSDPTWRYNIDATFGGYWQCPNSGVVQTFDPNSQGAYDFIHQFSASGFTIIFMFRDTGGAQGILAKQFDATRGFQIQKVSQRWQLNTFGSDASGFQFGLTNSPGFTQYSLNTWYMACLTFSGTGGSASTGLASYIIPMKTGIVTADVTTAKSTNVQNLSGDTLGSTGSVAAPLTIGNSGFVPYDLQWANLQIRNEALSDAQIANACNFLTS